ncbi:T9SS type A sorting domain-containing protein [uncultured Kordia sp.]|uniref:T9SS type A sorting domain-containing protein n=1 Tax=uncultured Kordia sp. TaxID=507699 RepID=UPI00261E900B|nr:T9SS type A sorting domain-containing protein [uncultured Kordia sp.]
MKKITLILFILFSTYTSFSQDTEAPTTPVNFQFIDNPIVQPDDISVEWEHSTDNVGVETYEIYINGTLSRIVAYDGTGAIQYASFVNYPNGSYCLTILARDAAGNASPISGQVCKTVNVIYQNGPAELYLSGFVNYSGSEKAIEVSNMTFSAIDLSDYSIKISYDGNATWDVVYTFPANSMISPLESFIIAHPSFSICTDVITNLGINVDYNANLTNIDGNDAIGLFKYDILYDMIGELGNNATHTNTDQFIKRGAYLAAIPNTLFNINTWDMEVSNGSCPGLFGFPNMVLLSTEDVELNSFQIYPNPTNGDIVTIDTKNNVEITAVKVFDLTGKQVLQQTNVSNEINVQSLQQGMYILQLETENQTITKKLIKQ